MNNLSEAYLSVYEATAMAKRGLDEPAIRKQIASNTKGGEAADRATALENQPTYGDKNKEAQRSRYARAQRGDFRRTTSSSPGLHGYAHKSDDPEVKAKQAARGAQRGVLTSAEKKQLNRESFGDILESHFAVGDKVICKDSGMKGEVVKLDKPDGAEDEKYYTVKREDGKKMKYAPNELKSAGKEMKEEADLFDYLLEYLVAEGYADTNDAAIKIMANMSEEWKESIIDEAYKDFPTAKVMKKAGDLMGSSAGKTDPKSKKKEKRGIKMMDTMMQHSPDR